VTITRRLAPTLVALASIQVLVDSAWTTGLVLAAGRASRLWAVSQPASGSNAPSA